MRSILVLVLLLSACSPESADSTSASTAAVADQFIDAFYSWDEEQLRHAVAAASREDIERVLYYQGWAVGAHYKIQTRRPCTQTGNVATCKITVTDDFGEAMAYTATDTFELILKNEVIVNVTFQGDDPAIFGELQAWIGEHQPGIYSGPCKDLFAGGKTPGDCARAVATAAKTFMNHQN